MILVVVVLTLIGCGRQVTSDDNDRRMAKVEACKDIVDDVSRFLCLETAP